MLIRLVAYYLRLWLSRRNLTIVCCTAILHRSVISWIGSAIAPGGTPEAFSGPICEYQPPETISDVPHVPQGMPPVGPSEATLHFAGDRGAATPTTFEGVNPGAPPPSGKLYRGRFVDEMPSLLNAPNVRLPDYVGRVAIEGTVRLEFVVDSTGQVEPESVRILDAPHSAFAAAARDVVLESRFRPGRIRGYPVRVLVSQTIRFAMG